MTDEVSVREPSNSELLARSLFISSPLEEPNLVLELPQGVRMNGILAAYDHRSFRLPCAECGVARHYKGYLVELSDGRRTLLGNRCGAKVFGEAWTVHQRQFRRLIDRQALLRRAADILERLPALVPAAIVWRQALDASLNAFVTFERNFPTVMRDLRLAAEKEDGWLSDDFPRHSSELAPTGARVERRRMGRLAGIDAFRIRTLDRQLSSGIHTLRDARRFLERPNIDDKTLERVVQACGSAIEALLQTAAVHNSVLDFLSERNLRLIGAWASRRPSCEHECHGGRLERSQVERVVSSQPSDRPRVITKTKISPSRRVKAQEILKKAHLERTVSNLPNAHPKLFAFVYPKRRPVIQNVRHVIRPPTIDDIAPLDPAVMVRLTGTGPGYGVGKGSRAIA